jgi:phosphatidylinositol alpha-1,6-mannosyltransferase
LERLVVENGVSDTVQFLGELPDERLIECYQQCDLFVLPNREVDGDFEGFGMVLLEAQACGKPVIAGDSGGTAETMVPGVTGLIADCTSPEPRSCAWQQIKALKDKTNFKITNFRELVLVQSFHILAVEVILAGRGFVQATENIQHCRLAGTG